MNEPKLCDENIMGHRGTDFLTAGAIRPSRLDELQPDDACKVVTDTVRKDFGATIDSLVFAPIDDKTLKTIEHLTMESLERTAPHLPHTVCAYAETWKTLYPKWWMRTKARIAYRLLQWGVIQTHERKWYHSFFPFKIEDRTSIVEHMEAIFFDAIMEVARSISDGHSAADRESATQEFIDIIDQYIKKDEVIHLEDPHGIVDVKIGVSMPLTQSKINCEFEITPEKG